MKCIGKYSKLISVLLLTVVMATGCGITDLLGTKNGLFAEEHCPNRPQEIRWREDAELQKPDGAASGR